MPPSASPYVATEQIPRSSPPIAPTACRHPRHPPHLSPRVAAAPGPWLARTAPYASLFRRMREKGPLPGNIRPKCMLFEIKMATSSPHASVSGRNRAIQDAWRANLAAKGPFPRRGARNHAWREDVASAARPFRGSGMRHGRTGFAPCGAGLACLPHARPLPSRLCPPRPAPPRHLARVHRRRLTCVALRHPHRAHRAPPFAAPPIAVGASRRSGSSCCPRAAHADASRPPMRARWHRPSPNPRQPNPGPEPTESRPPWSHLRPPAPRHPPRLTLPRGSRCGSGNSREMVR